MDIFYLLNCAQWLSQLRSFTNNLMRIVCSDSECVGVWMVNRKLFCYFRFAYVRSWQWRKKNFFNSLLNDSILKGNSQYVGKKSVKRKYIH